LPYISKQDRKELDRGRSNGSPGELNYAITKLCLEYISNWSKRYQNYNDVIGALESCKLEFYARAVRPYEDEKIKENGDVF
jgi:hypothetical protein